MPSRPNGALDPRALAGFDEHRLGPGYALSLLRDGQRVDSLCVGYANLEHRLRIGPRTRFHVASLAKQFTGLAVALLEAEGALRYDAPASDYLPGYPVLEGVHISHLLHHTSGLRDQWVLTEVAGWRANDTIVTEDVLWLLRRQRSLQFAPGARFLYSNSGYTLLAAIVERVTGDDLATFVRRRVFDPLGMNDTGFLSDPGIVVPDRADAYSRSKGQGGVFSRFSPNLYVPGSTSLVTTLEDMEKWDRNFHLPRVGPVELLDRVRTPGRLADGSVCPYGYGFFCGTATDEVAYHTAMDSGFHAFYGQYRDGVSIVILSNADPPALWDMAREIAHGSRVGAPPAVARDRREDAAAFIGVYENRSLDNVVSVDARGDDLVLVAGRSAVLRPLGSDRFRHEGSPTICEFLRDRTQAVVGVHIASAVSSEDFVKLPATTPSAPLLRDLCGRFWSTDLRCVVEIVSMCDGLALDLPRRQRVTLRPVTDDLLLAGPGWIRPVREQGATTGFLLSEARARAMAFERIDLP